MTTSTGTLTLTTALATYPHTKSLLDGSIKPEGVNLQFVDLPNGAVPAFRRMCRNLEYDVSEMAIVSYLVGKHYGLPFTAIPAFPNGRFHHHELRYNVNSGIKTAKDFEGKRIGSRAYSVTPAIWCRYILSEECGVDLDSITWVVGDEEHVDQLHADLPGNVERRIGEDMGQLLARGEIDAGLNVRTDSPDVVPLFPDPVAADRAEYERTGVYPMDHCVVIKDSVLQEHPWVAEAIYRAMVEAKEAFFKQEPNAKIGGAGILPGDPVPYGLEANRKNIDACSEACMKQKLVPRFYSADELYLAFN